MERPVFFSDQLVMADDLNAIHETFASQSVLRTLSLYTAPSGGVFGSRLEAGSWSQLRVSEGNYKTLVVSPGNAVSPFGDIIYVPDWVALVTGSVGPYYTWTGTAVGLYYVKIQYQESSGGVKTDDYLTDYFTRYIGGYYINVNTSPPIIGELCLATAYLNPTDIGTITDTRSYVTITTPAQGVIIDSTLNRVPAVQSAYDHITAVGTGTVTLKNPHGTSSADIGATSLDQASLFGTPTIGNVTFNTVYRNTGIHAMYFEGSLTTVTGGWAGPLNSYSVYTSATGTLTDATGSLSGTIHEIARFASQISQSKSTDTMTMQECVRGIIPSMWYYKIGSTTGTAAPVGSIKFTTTSI